ncbi:unnamed protein product [Effrenium voratum]|nr:unnamed protein product [Effrenium voratum]
MGRWHDRSRSPKAGKRQWVSKTLASFGRYKDRRPQGLEVDHSGCLLLSNLMEVWGHSQGLADEDVLTAVKENLINERTGGARFVLTPAAGDWQIQVHRSGGDWASSGGGWKANSNAAPATNSWQANTKQEWGEPWKDKWKDPKDSKDWKKEDAWGSNSWTAPVKEEKTDDTWAQSESRQNWTKSSPGWRFQGNQASQANAAPPEHSSGNSWNNSSNSWNSNHSQSRRQSNWKGHQDKPEQIQRFMGYLLKNGKEEHVYSDYDGWAPVSQIIAAIQRRHSDWGINSPEDLNKMLQESDHEGRFIMEGQRIRKVDRNARRAPPEPVNVPVKPTASKRFNAFTVKKQEEEEEEDEGNFGEDDDTPGVASVQGQKPPRKPPGRHWTQYDDNSTIWWYYEGPRGQWYMGPEHTEPQVFLAGAPEE